MGSLTHRSLVTLLVGTAVTTGAAQSALPRLALDAYPAVARDALSRAHDRAAAHPSDADAIGAFARALHAWEQWSAADDLYVRAAELAPASFEWPYLDAVVLQRLAQPDRAVTRLRQALAANAGYLPAQLRLAEALLDAGDLDASGQLFAALKDPACAPAVAFGLGRIAAARGDHGRAIPEFERAIALFPEFGAAHYALALSYRAAGRRDEAQASLRRHEQFGARWPAIPDPLLDAVTALRDDPAALLRRGTKLADTGNLDGAIAAYEGALAQDPGLAQAHADLIGLYGRTGNWSKGEEHYRALVRLDVNLADAHYDYGVLLALQQNWEGAAEAYGKALALNPLHAGAHNNLGQIRERDRRFEDAATEYRRALDSQPTLRIARFNLGRMLLAQNQTDAAIAQLETLKEPRDAEAPRYLFGLAAAHVRAGHRAEGLALAEDARQLALQFGQTALAASIERDIASLK